MNVAVATVHWGDLDRSDSGSFEGLLSPDERSRAESFRFQRDRSRFVSARGLLRTLVGERLGRDPSRIEFAYGERGKPRIAGRDDLHFNLSHSDGVVALAICEGREVGVDVEAQRPGRSMEGISRRYLPPEVASEIERTTGTDRLRAFYRAWVRQEAYAKGRGEGLELIGEAPDPRRWSIADLELIDGYAAAVAVQGAAPVRVIARPI
jgi:4'-phosphopantetheinyl transferase